MPLLVDCCGIVAGGGVSMSRHAADLDARLVGRLPAKMIKVHELVGFRDRQRWVCLEWRVWAGAANC